MNTLKSFLFLITCSLLKIFNSVKSRNVNIKSTNYQARFNRNLRLNRQRNLNDLRKRVNTNDNVFEQTFSQTYFGKDLQKLNENKIIEYEKLMTEIAQNLTNPSVSVKCTWINHGNIRRKRKDRMIKRKKVNQMHKRKNKSNRNLESSHDYLILRNLNECSTEKTTSLTEFYLTWSSTSDENVTKYFESYMHYMNSHEGRFVTASQLREINICAISARPSKVIPSIVMNVRGQYNQTYIGLWEDLNLHQLEAYETYFESLTIKYTNKSVIAKCSVSYQEADIVNYGLTWDIKMSSEMLYIPKDVEKDLLSNFLNYVNKEGLKDIKMFMQSIDVSIDEVRETSYVGNQGPNNNEGNTTKKGYKICGSECIGIGYPPPLAKEYCGSECIGIGYPPPSVPPSKYNKQEP